MSGRCPALTAALALAGAQADRIARGDLDAYIAGFDAYEAACLHAVQQAMERDADGIVTLAAAHEQLMEHGQSALAELGRRLATLRAGQTSVAAYHPSLPADALVRGEG